MREITNLYMTIHVDTYNKTIILVGDAVIPCSEIAEMKPPYVCPGCLIHTYSNNMINRCHIQ
jgi:hypothetical protein